MKVPLYVLPILGTAAVTLLLGMSGNPSPAKGQPAPAKAAGTYFFQSVPQSTGQAVNGFLTLHASGTCTWADQSDFGAAGAFNSTTHGVWKRSDDQNEVTIQGYYYQFDPAGTPVALIRITVVGSLAGGHGMGTVDIFGPTQNPVLEQPATANADTLTITSFRVVP